MLGYITILRGQNKIKQDKNYEFQFHISDLQVILNRILEKISDKMGKLFFRSSQLLNPTEFKI